jgi:4,5-dihydroxyphthalate decarboxylase
VEKVALRLRPACITPARTKRSPQLASGRLIAVISARDWRLARLPTTRRAEYFKKTRICPLMHVIVLRREVYERDRWIAMNLFSAFEQAKRAAQARITEIGLSHVPMPWLAEHARRWREIAGEDLWPYGIGANRPTLEAFLQYAHEQGVALRRLRVEELFAPETLERAKI